LQVGDELSQFNGENIPRHVEYWLRNKKPGDELHLRLLRHEQIVDLKFALGGKSETIFTVAEDAQASPKARAIRQGLLHGMPAPALSMPALK
jgi:hypothetical protein